MELVSAITACMADAAGANDSFRLLVGIHTDVGWEQMLVLAPLSISLMGQIMQLASGLHDEPIDKNPGRLIQFPDSFNATLMQVINTVHRVFREAHNHMEKISTLMFRVPSDVRETAQMLNMSASVDIDIDRVLPVYVERIRVAAEQGEKLSREVECSFDHLMELINQVLVAVTTRARYEQLKLMDDTRGQLEMLKEHKEDDKKRLEREMVHEMEAIRRANERMPSGWSMLFMDLVESMFLLSRTASQRSVINARNMERRAEERLQDTRRQYQQTAEQIVNINDQINDIPNLSVANPTRNAAVKLLKNGLDALTQLRTHWAHLVVHFQRINRLIVFKPDKFVSHKGCASPFTTEFLLVASQLAYLASNIADKYLDASNRYVMDNIASLEQMIVHPDQVASQHCELVESCKEATEGILSMVKLEKDLRISELAKKQIYL